MSSIGFEFGDEVFCSFNDEKGIQREGWFYVIEVGQTAVILRTKNGSVIFIPSSKVLKVKKKGGQDG